MKQVRKLRKEDGSLWTVNTLAKYFSTLPSVIRCVFCYWAVCVCVTYTECTLIHAYVLPQESFQCRSEEAEGVGWRKSFACKDEATQKEDVQIGEAIGQRTTTMLVTSLLLWCLKNCVVRNAIWRPYIKIVREWVQCMDDVISLTKRPVVCIWSLKVSCSYFRNMHWGVGGGCYCNSVNMPYAMING